MTAGPDRVVVLYSHPLLGEGLGRMLAAEPGIVVTTVSLDTIATLDDALAGRPDVVVFEEGGPIGVLEVLRRSGATVVIDVDITSSTAWTLKRQPLRSDPEEVLAAIRDAGKQIPEELSFVGYDHIDVLVLNNPPVTIVRRPVEEMGGEAADLLLASLGGQIAEPTTRIMYSRLEIRGSTGRPAQ